MLNRKNVEYPRQGIILTSALKVLILNLIYLSEILNDSSDLLRTQKYSL